MNEIIEKHQSYLAKQSRFGSYQVYGHHFYNNKKGVNVQPIYESYSTREERDKNFERIKKLILESKNKKIIIFAP